VGRRGVISSFHPVARKEHHNAQIHFKNNLARTWANHPFYKVYRIITFAGLVYSVSVLAESQLEERSGTVARPQPHAQPALLPLFFTGM
jgi:hypothetical protein